MQDAGSELHFQRSLMGRVANHFAVYLEPASCMGYMPVALHTGTPQASAQDQSSAGSWLDFIGDGRCLDWKKTTAAIHRHARFRLVIGDVGYFCLILERDE